MTRYRCSWCSGILWPFQKLTDGGTMHSRCGVYVDRITAENQVHYEPWEYRQLESWEEQQWRLRKEEEDRL
jgi:hypothetical protein